MSNFWYAALSVVGDIETAGTSENHKLQLFQNCHYPPLA